MAILEHTGHSTTTRLYANGSADGTFSNRGSEIAGIIFGFEIIYFEKDKECHCVCVERHIRLGM